MAAPVSSAAMHFEVRTDGKFYVGGIKCSVKKGGQEITKREDLEKIAAIFNKTVKPIAIVQGEVWHIKPEGITIHAGKTIKKNKVVVFKSDSAKADFKKELQDLITRINSVKNVAS